MNTILAIIVLFVIAQSVADAAPVPAKRIGVASWYGDREHGRRTASGEKFNKLALTCATWKYPFGTLLRVTVIDSNRSVVVRVNDRGPHKRLGRLVDLSEGAFRRIAPLRQGLVIVEIQPL